MKIIILLLFIGIFFITNGIYEQKLRAAESNVKVEYRFVPRSYYDEQMGPPDVSLKFADMFNKESPWSDVTTGPVLPQSQYIIHTKTGS